MKILDLTLNLIYVIFFMTFVTWFTQDKMEQLFMAVFIVLYELKCIDDKLERLVK